MANKLILGGTNHVAQESLLWQRILESQASEGKIAIGVESVTRESISERRYARSLRKDKGLIFGIENDFAYSFSIVGIGYMGMAHQKPLDMDHRGQFIYNIMTSDATKRAWAALKQQEMEPCSRALYDGLAGIISKHSRIGAANVAQAFVRQGPMENYHAWQGLFESMLRQMYHHSQAFDEKDRPSSLAVELLLKNPLDVLATSLFLNEVSGEYRNSYIKPNIGQIASIAAKYAVDAIIPIGMKHVKKLAQSLGNECNGLIVHAYESLDKIPREHWGF